ncbi:MAG: sensor histidine kinase [Hyphomicrobiaceae bacterium]
MANERFSIPAMAYEPSSNPSFLDEYGLQNADHPVFVWDGDANAFAWANTAGLDHWGAISLQTFRASRLDRAMPAMIRLRELSRTALPANGISQTLMFWTSRGACRLDCRCRPVDLGDGGHGLLLEIDPAVQAVANGRAADDVPAAHGRDPTAPTPDGAGHDAALSRTARANGQRVSGFLNGSVVAEQTAQLPAPSDEDHAAMAEIARMLGRPGAETKSPDGDVENRVGQPHDNTTKNDSGEQLRRDVLELADDRPLDPVEMRPAPVSAPSANDFDTLNHELRTPLNSIIGFAEMMHSEQLGPVGNERYREYIGDILDSARHALSLINDLLDTSRVRAGHLDVTHEELEVPELLERTIALMQPQAQKAAVVIVPGFPDTMRTIHADARAMRQILLNVLSNAIKFTGRGGRVFVTASRDAAGNTTIGVRDTGVGMTEDQLDRAMMPWEQVSKTADERKSGAGELAGSGLGLPLVRALTEAQGGALAIRSTPGEGTRVEITIPPRDEPETSPSDTSPLDTSI